GSGNMSLFYIGNGKGSFVNGGKEVQHMESCCRGCMQLYIFFGEVFRIFLLFIDHILMYGSSFSVGNKIVLHNTARKSALIAIEFQRPWVFRICGSTPSSVLPNTIEFVILKNGILRIGNIGLAFFLYIYASDRSYLVGPAQV